MPNSELWNLDGQGLDEWDWGTMHGFLLAQLLNSWLEHGSHCASLPSLRLSQQTPPGVRHWALASDPSGAQGDESASPAWNPCAVTASHCWSKLPKIAIIEELATRQWGWQYPAWFGLLCQFPLWVLESICCPCYCCVCLSLPTSRSTGHFGTGPALPRAACSIALSLSCFKHSDPTTPCKFYAE